MPQYKLIGSTRTTSHLGSKCDLIIRQPEEHEYNLYSLMGAQLIKEDAQFKDLLVMTVLYADGKAFGPTVVMGFKDSHKEGCYIFQHPSLTKTHQWAMRFLRIDNC